MTNLPRSLDSGGGASWPHSFDKDNSKRPEGDWGDIWGGVGLRRATCGPIDDWGSEITNSFSYFLPVLYSTRKSGRSLARFLPCRDRGGTTCGLSSKLALALPAPLVSTSSSTPSSLSHLKITSTNARQDSRNTLA